MELAAGDYVIHFDSDDWAELNWLESMYIKAIEDNADVVVCDYFEKYSHASIYKSQSIGLDRDTCLKNLLLGKIANSSCNKLVSRRLLSVSYTHLAGFWVLRVRAGAGAGRDHSYRTSGLPLSACRYTGAGGLAGVRPSPSACKRLRYEFNCLKLNMFTCPGLDAGTKQGNPQQRLSGFTEGSIT